MGWNSWAENVRESLGGSSLVCGEECCLLLARESQASYAKTILWRGGRRLTSSTQAIM